MHEDIRRAPLTELARTAVELETRGEFVVVVAPPAPDAERMSPQALDDVLKEALQTQSVKDAVAYAVGLSGRPRREVYARALELSKQLAGPSQ
jgi:16S rRNA (cytidine1402-2'-O)-methyltransferase